MRKTRFPIACALLLGCTTAEPEPPGGVPPDPNRPRDQVSVEEMMSMFRADFERARQK